MKHRMVFPQNNGLLDKINHTLVQPGPAPVHPANLIVLTVGIVIALLRIAKFISSINQRRPLAEHNHEKSVFDLLDPQCTDSLFACGPFRAAVPGVIVDTSVLVVFLIRLVVALLITYHILESESILIGHIIDNSTGIRVPAHAVDGGSQRISVSFEPFPHILLKPFIILCHVPVFTSRAHSLKEQFGTAENRVLNQKALGNIPHQMKSINMILNSPMPENGLYHLGIISLRKIKFHDAFHLGFVQRFHQLLKFPCRVVLPAAVSRFRSKVIALGIAPEI